MVSLSMRGARSPCIDLPRVMHGDQYPHTDATYHIGSGGKGEGMHVLNMGGNRCYSYTMALHEHLHSVGLIHEISGD